MSNSSIRLVRDRLAELSTNGLEYATALHDAAMGQNEFADLEPKDRGPFLKMALGALGVALEAPKAVAVMDVTDSGRRLDPTLVAALQSELAMLTVNATRTALPPGDDE